TARPAEARAGARPARSLESGGIQGAGMSGDTDQEGGEAEMPLRACVLPVTPFQQNCSLLWCTATQRGALIDPGGEIDRLLAMVDQQGVTLERILVTHGHMDHAGAVADLAERTGVPVEGPQRADSFWIDQMGADGGRYGLKGRPFVP